MNGDLASPVTWAAGAGALAYLFVKVKARLELSKAKHPSLRGHARISRLVAKLVPFYDYDEERFFSSDDAPPEIVARRREGFWRLVKLYQDRFPETRRLTEEAAPGISDLQFTSAYRVPFLFSAFMTAIRPAIPARRARRPATAFPSRLGGPGASCGHWFGWYWRATAPRPSPAEQLDRLH